MNINENTGKVNSNPEINSLTNGQRSLHLLRVLPAELLEWPMAFWLKGDKRPITVEAAQLGYPEKHIGDAATINASTTDPATWVAGKVAIETLAHVSERIGGCGAMGGEGAIIFDLDDPARKFVDIEDVAYWKQWNDELAHEWARLGAYVERSPSGFGWRIIMLGSTQHKSYAIAGLSHIYTNGQFLRLTGDVLRIDGTPPVTKLPNLQVALDAFLKLDRVSPVGATNGDTPPVTGGDGTYTTEWLRELLTFVRVEGHEPWIEIGICLHTETGGHGFDLWDEWSRVTGGAHYTGSDDLHRIWKGFNKPGDPRAGKKTVGTITDLARKGGADIVAIRLRHDPMVIYGREHRAELDAWVQAMMAYFRAKREALETEQMAEIASLAAEVKADSDDNPYDTTPAFVLDYPPGLVGSLAYEIEQMMPYPSRTAAIATALSTMACFGQRVYCIENLGVNTYEMILAETQSFKETISEAPSSMIWQLMKEYPHLLRLNLLQGSQPVSGEGVLNGLCRKPRQHITLNEASFLFDDMASANNPHATNKKKAILEVYPKAGPNGYLAGATHSKSANSVGYCLSPAYSILGEGQPNRFYSAIDEQDARDGTINRLDIFDCSRSWRGPYNEGRRHGFSRDLVAAFKPLAQISNDASFEAIVRDEFKQVQLASDAAKLLREYDQDVVEKLLPQGDELKYNLFGRTVARIKQYSALLAIGDGPDGPLVGRDRLNWVRDMVHRERTMLYDRMNAGLVGAGDARRLSDMMHILAEFSATGDEGISTKQRKLGIFPNWWLRKRAKRRESFKRDGGRFNQCYEGAVRALIMDGVLCELTAEEKKEFGLTCTKINVKALKNSMR